MIKETTSLILRTYIAHTPYHHFSQYTGSFTLPILSIINYWLSRLKVLYRYLTSAPNLKGIFFFYVLWQGVELFAAEFYPPQEPNL